MLFILSSQRDIVIRAVNVRTNIFLIELMLALKMNCNTIKLQTNKQE